MREALNVMGDGRYRDALDKLRLEVRPLYVYRSYLRVRTALVPRRWYRMCVRVQTSVMSGCPGERLWMESDSSVGRCNCEHED